MAFEKILNRLKRFAGIGRDAATDRHIKNVGEVSLASWQEQTLRGLDKDGKPLHSVKPRKGVYKGGMGPPLSPWMRGSRTMLGSRVEVTRTPAGFSVLLKVVDIKKSPVVRTRSGIPAYGKGAWKTLNSHKSQFRKGKAGTASFPDILRYHAAGKAGRSRIVRNVLGLSPATKAKIAKLNQEFLARYSQP